MEYDAIKILGWTRKKFSSKKKPLDVELIFSPPRRILAQLTEAVSVKAVLRDVGKCLAIHEE